MDMTVWVDAWQMQCCGETFTVGSEVSWTLRDVDSDWLTMVLGDAAVTVDAAEEHHSGRSDEVPVTRAKVGHITAVHCRYAPRPGDDSRTRYPVEGSATLTAMASADGWTPPCGDLEFVGCLVRLVVRLRCPPE
ncbi:hypothetical protein HKK72_34620 [Actinomadura sp. HBU206391]|nr:hypothetical protein [Actinomadura sp. HBU206391]